MYHEDDYLQLSGIQHFVFCRRQWALIHLEQQWAENYRTVDGNILHLHVHNADVRERRGDVVTVRAMAVSSPRLGISGECDVVEFRRSNSGIPVFGLEGTYETVPVEYKRGEPKEHDSDTMQLAAQAMCLEEMLCCEIPVGYLFYGETRRRTRIVLDASLRERTEAVITQMHMLYARGTTPKVKRSKACNACSLKQICLPVISGTRQASDYVKEMLETEANE